jgi:predicted  nucleic acid-binding Zn-ribbon protein
MTDATVSSNADRRAKLEYELARLELEIDEKRDEITCLRDELDDLEIERSRVLDELDEVEEGGDED